MHGIACTVTPDPKGAERLLIRILADISPQSVAESEELRACFVRFFEKGSTETCSRLIPEKHKIALPSLPPNLSPHSPTCTASSSIQPTLTTSPNPPTPHSPTTLTRRPRPNSSSSSVSNLPAKSPERHALSRPQSSPPPSSNNFCLKCHFEHSTGGGDEKRANRLVEAALGFINDEPLSEMDCSKLWLMERIDVFEDSMQDSYPSVAWSPSRLRRLHLGHQRSKRKSVTINCANRLFLVIKAHAVDHLREHATLNLDAGVGRKSAALEKLADIYSVPKIDVLSEYKRSKNYLRIIALDGPGSVLDLGDGSGPLWERQVTKDDSSCLLSFRKQMLPKYYERSQQRNFIASRTILEGMLQCGWSLPEIAKYGGDLIGQLGRYVRIDGLACNVIEPCDDVLVSGGDPRTSIVEAQINGARIITQCGKHHSKTSRRKRKTDGVCLGSTKRCCCRRADGDQSECTPRREAVRQTTYPQVPRPEVTPGNGSSIGTPAVRVSPNQDGAALTRRSIDSSSPSVSSSAPDSSLPFPTQWKEQTILDSIIATHRNATDSSDNGQSAIEVSNGPQFNDDNACDELENLDPAEVATAMGNNSVSLTVATDQVARVCRKDAREESEEVVGTRDDGLVGAFFESQGCLSTHAPDTDELLQQTGSFSIASLLKEPESDTRSWCQPQAEPAIISNGHRSIASRQIGNQDMDENGLSAHFANEFSDPTSDTIVDLERNLQLFNDAAAAAESNTPVNLWFENDLARSPQY